MPVSLLLLFLALNYHANSILGALGLGSADSVGWIRVVQTLAWIFAAALFNQVSRWLLWERVVARAIGGPVPGVLKEIFAVLVYLAALTCVVALVYEHSVTGFLAAVGAGGVVLGFALRELFSDIFTGLAINIDRTFAIGDWVQINESGDDPTVARIREIGWRCTSLVTEDQTTMIVPNSMLGRERLINITQPIEPTRFHLTVTVEYSVPSERVKRVLLASLKALAQEPGFDSSHEPTVLVSKASSRGVEYLLRYWILPWHPQSPTAWRDHVLTSALRHLRTAGISLAYPKTDVYHAAMPERQIDGHNAAGESKLLSKIQLFESLQDEEIRHLVQSLHRHVVAPAQALVHAGAEGDSLFILIEGLLAVQIERGGQMQQVALLQPGDFFGEMSLLTGERRSATVSCVSESVVYEIRKEALKHIMEQNPEVAERLSRILAQRQLLTSQELERPQHSGESDDLDGLARQLLGRMRDFFGLVRLHTVR
jgi:small-conductance mechanosensitive channel/CRP-like cAMP-binding protein